MAYYRLGDVKKNASIIGRLKLYFSPDSHVFRKKFTHGKSGYRQDPLAILIYVVLLGGLVTGFASFGI